MWEMIMERVVSYTQIRVMEHKYFHFKCKRYDDLHDVLLYGNNFLFFKIFAFTPGYSCCGLCIYI